MLDPTPVAVYINTVDQEQTILERSIESSLTGWTPQITQEQSYRGVPISLEHVKLALSHPHGWIEYDSEAEPDRIIEEWEEVEVITVPGPALCTRSGTGVGGIR